VGGERSFERRTVAVLGIGVRRINFYCSRLRKPEEKEEEEQQNGEREDAAQRRRGGTVGPGKAGTGGTATELIVANEDYAVQRKSAVERDRTQGSGGLEAVGSGDGQRNGGLREVAAFRGSEKEGVEGDRGTGLRDVREGVEGGATASFDSRAIRSDFVGTCPKLAQRRPQKSDQEEQN